MVKESFVFLTGVGVLVAALAWFVYVPQNTDVGVCPSGYTHPSQELLGYNFHSHNDIHGECFFSDGYEHATERFMKAADLLGAETSSMQVTDTLSTSVAILRGNPEQYAIHISGTHGPESYAGSATQIAALEYLYVNKILNGIPEENRPTIVFVHALNPYGFKTGRRVNENNIDLNRNFLTDEQFEFVKSRDPNYAGYVDLDSALNPKSQPFKTISYNELYSYYNLVVSALKYGTGRIKKAMVSGNYFNSKGFGFGGFQRSQSANNLIDLLVHKLDIPHRAKHVVLIDVHTGLGPFGVDTLLGLADADSLDQAKTADIARIFPMDYDHDNLVRGGLYDPPKEYDSDNGIAASSKAAAAVGSGYELTIGTVSGSFCHNMLAPHLKGNDRVCVTQEFGTRDMLLVGKVVLYSGRLYLLTFMFVAVFSAGELCLPARY